MSPTEILRSEHRAIERALEVLSTMIDDLREHRATRTAELVEIIAFLQGYADELHHQKEERALFIALARAGLPAQGGPVAVMLHEHEEGRALLDQLAELAPVVASSLDAQRAFIDSASRYVELLDNHIAKENQILFPMAERLLPEAAKTELLAQFAELDQAASTSGARARFERSLEALEQRQRPTVQRRPQARP